MHFNGLMYTTQSQASNTSLMTLKTTVHAAHQLDLHHWNLFLSHGLPQNLVYTLTALSSNSLSIIHPGQSIDGGTNHIQWVVGADALG